MQDLPRANYRQRSLQGKRARHRACPLTRPKPRSKTPYQNNRVGKRNSCRQLSKEKPCNNHVKNHANSIKKPRKNHAKSNKNRANKSVLRAATFVIMFFLNVFLPDLASPQGGAGSATALLRPGRGRVHTSEALLRPGRGRINTITALSRRSCGRVTSSALLRQCHERVKTSSGSAVLDISPAP